MTKFYVYTGVMADGRYERFFTDEEHRQTCEEEIINRSNSDEFSEIYLNKADFCFNGYLYIGDYIRKIK